MCGFAGFIDHTSNSGLDTLKAMSDVISHRGPDDEGNELFSFSNGSIGLTFRRLSIIDLSEAGHQPMKLIDADLWITFNGEIYNYKELKEELLGYGHTFVSGSDTEVILRSYLQWGRDCASHFNGMFAFALYDIAKGKLFLFRDRAGVKPLFYYEDSGLFLFGSELKSFHEHPGFKPEIDTNALGSYFQRGYIPAPHSIFKNCKKLLPGNSLEINLTTLNTDLSCYWNVAEVYSKPILKISREDAISQLDTLFKSAFNYRMVADVPVGVFLSGGYDSTAVAAILSASGTPNLNTYTIAFDEATYNEAPFAKKVAEHLGTNHHEETCTIAQGLEIVPQLADIYDEPFGDSSAIPTTLVSQIARKHVKVALSADGGDEIFAGYPKYNKGVEYFKRIQSNPELLRKFIKLSGDLFRKLSRNSISSADRFDKLSSVITSKDPVKTFDVISQAMTLSEASKLTGLDLNNARTYFDENNTFGNDVSILNRLLATEYRTYMADDILCKVDRATMSASLEGREPFLDQRIVEFAALLPEEYKWSMGKGKLILKELVHKYVPAEMMDRPKMGFGVPIEKWCKDELKDWVMELLSEETLNQCPYLDKDEVIALKNDFYSHKKIDFQRLWFVIIFVQWYKRWILKK